MLTNLAKAVAGLVIATPVALVADFITLGGALTDRDEAYTVRALSNVVRNIEDATKPERR